MKDGVVDELEEYPWTSHLGYLSPSDKWDWLHKEPVLSQFSEDPVKARKGYRLYMAQEDDEKIVRIFSLKKLPAVLGRQEFVQKIKERFFASKKDRQSSADTLFPTISKNKTVLENSDLRKC